MYEVPAGFPEAHLTNYPVSAANSLIHVTPLAAKNSSTLIYTAQHLNPSVLESNWLLKQLLSLNNAISLERNTKNQWLYYISMTNYASSLNLESNKS